MVIEKEWYTIAEAAEYLAISRRTVYKLIENKRLPAFRIGLEHHRRFRKEDLDKVPVAEKEAILLECVIGLTSQTDPVLAEIWDNARDAAYDRI